LNSDAAHERDLFAIGRPGRLVFIGGACGPLGELAGGHFDRPDIVTALESAVGRERDPGSVGRELRLTIIAVAARDLAHSAAIRMHDPDVEGSAFVRFEGDQITLRRVVGTRRLQHGIGQLPGRTARDRKRP
jgi:hypothetical protein